MIKIHQSVPDSGSKQKLIKLNVNWNVSNISLFRLWWFGLFWPVATIVERKTKTLLNTQNVLRLITSECGLFHDMFSQDASASAGECAADDQSRITSVRLELNVAAIPWQRAKTLHLTWFNGIFLLFHNFYEQGKGRRLREKHSVSGREDQIKGKSHVYSAILVFIVLSIVRRERSSYDLGSIWHFLRRTSPITFQERAAGFGGERWAEWMNHITSTYNAIQ